MDRTRIYNRQKKTHYTSYEKTLVINAKVFKQIDAELKLENNLSQYSQFSLSQVDVLLVVNITYNNLVNFD